LGWGCKGGVGSAEGSIVMTLQKMLIYMPEAHPHGRPQGCTDTKSPQYVYLAGSEEFDEVLVTFLPQQRKADFV